MDYILIRLLLPKTAPISREISATKIRYTIEKPFELLSLSFFFDAGPVDKFLCLLKSYESSNFYILESLALNSDFSFYNFDILSFSRSISC